MRIAIIGAGMAGLACARALADAGFEVALFDKGRAAGGRMATRRVMSPVGPVSFDHGAQYITAHDPAFRTEIETWRDGGLVRRWPAAGEDAWVGVPGMNAPLQAMSRDLPVRWRTRVDAVLREAEGWRLRGEGLDAGGFDAILSALPAEQTASLLQDSAPDIAARAGATRSQPCWTAMAAFAERLDIAPDIVRTDGPVRWAACNASKPDRPGMEAWVIQASPEWSRDNLERDAAGVADDLLELFFAAAPTAPAKPVLLIGHRWRYAESGAAGCDVLWDAERGIGACGDWLIGPRIENAWLSGRRLASAVATSARAGPAPRP